MLKPPGRKVTLMSGALALIGIAAWSVLLAIVAIARLGPPVLKRVGYPVLANRLERFRHTVRRYAAVGTPDGNPGPSHTNPRREA